MGVTTHRPIKNKTITYCNTGCWTERPPTYIVIDQEFHVWRRMKKQEIPFSVGVISAYNPHGTKAKPKDNQTAQSMLKSEIDKMRLIYVERDGAYMGHEEKHLLIKNISRRELIRLADTYLQVAVLYGERDGDDYCFDWIEGGKTLECKKTKAKWPVSLPRFEGDKK